jgi:hypothetical protein
MEDYADISQTVNVVADDVNEQTLLANFDQYLPSISMTCSLSLSLALLSISHSCLLLVGIRYHRK